MALALLEPSRKLSSEMLWMIMKMRMTMSLPNLELSLQELAALWIIDATGILWSSAK